LDRVANRPGTPLNAKDDEGYGQAKADHCQHNDKVPLPLPRPAAARQPTPGHFPVTWAQAERTGSSNQALDTGTAQRLEHRLQRPFLGVEFTASNQPDNVPDFAHACPVCARTLGKRAEYRIRRTQVMNIFAAVDDVHFAAAASGNWKGPRLS
jgi:hypothetical protein